MKGHVRPQGKGSFSIRVYDAKTRKYIQETYRGTRKGAEKRCAELIFETESGRRRDAATMTMEDFLGRWLTYLENTDLAPRTIHGYRRICELHLIPALGRTRLRELGADDLQRFYRRALDSGRRDDQKIKKVERDLPRDRALSSRTVLSFHRCLHTALEWGRRQGWIQQNVSELAKPPRPRKRRFRRLSVAEAKTLLHATKDGSLYPLVIFALLTAFRQGEQLGLRWTDIDFENGLIDPRQQLVKAGREPVFRELLKNEASENAIPMIPMLAETLKAHRKKQLEARMRAGSLWRDYGLVFTGLFGEPIDGSSLTRDDLKRALRNAGLPEIRWHDLRHSTASLLLDLGVDIAIVSRILRHANIQITADTYADPAMKTLRTALEKVGKALGE